MATRYIGTASEHPQVRSDIVGAASGGTLAGSQYLQLVWDDSVYGNTLEGKQRLRAALEMIKRRIETFKVWPIDSTAT
jgi:hypothetical protein